jgi:hypothetical protein
MQYEPLRMLRVRGYGSQKPDDKYGRLLEWLIVVVNRVFDRNAFRPPDLACGHTGTYISYR